MATIKINTVSAGPQFITLTPGSSYEVKCGESGSDFGKTVIEETSSTGSLISTITLVKYSAKEADTLWEKTTKAGYDSIGQRPQDFDYPVYDGFSGIDYLCLDLRNGFENIITNALGNDLPAEYSEWLAYANDSNAAENFAAGIADAEAQAAEVENSCSDSLSKCGVAGIGGFYFDPATGLSCDCEGGDACCLQLSNALKDQLIADAIPLVTKKHQYIFDSVTVTSPAP